MAKEEKKSELPPNGFSGPGLGDYFAGPMTPDEYNKKVHDNKEKNITAWNKETEKNIEKAKIDNGYLRPEIFDDLVVSRKAHLSDLIDKVSSYYKATPDSKLPNERQAKFLEAQAFCEYNDLVDKDVKQKYRSAHPDESPETLDSQVDRAKIVSRLAIPPRNGNGFFSSVAKTVYDSDKGEFQWGGILGVIGGLMFGNMLGGGFNGGVIGITMLVVAGVIGGFLGKGAADAMGSPTPTPPPPQTEAEKGRGKGRDLAPNGQGNNVDPLNPPVEIRNIPNEKISDEKKLSYSDASEKNLNSLNSPVTPAIRVAQLTQPAK